MFDVTIQGRVVYVRFYGEVTNAELTRAVNAAASDPELDRQRFHLVDWTEATLPPLDEHCMAALAPMIGATTTNPHIDTIFVPDTPATRTLATFWQPVLGGFRSLQVMPDVATAQAWIDRVMASTSSTGRFPALKD